MIYDACAAFLCIRALLLLLLVPDIHTHTHTRARAEAFCTHRGAKWKFAPRARSCELPDNLSGWWIDWATWIEMESAPAARASRALCWTKILHAKQTLMQARVIKTHGHKFTGRPVFAFVMKQKQHEIAFMESCSSATRRAEGFCCLLITTPQHVCAPLHALSAHTSAL